MTIKQTPMQELLVQINKKSAEDFYDWFKKNNIRLLYQEKYAIVDAFNEGIDFPFFADIKGNEYFTNIYVDILNLEYYYEQQSK